MGTTAHTIIMDAGRKAGVLGAGEEFDGSDSLDMLRLLKQMLEAWALEQLLIPYITKESFSLTGVGEYTMGPGGAWDTVAPIDILEIIILDAAGNEYRVRPTPLNMWVSMGSKSHNGRPAYFYLEQGYPLHTVLFSSIPEDPTARVYSRKPITTWQVEDLNFPTPNPEWSGQQVPTSSLDADTLQADIEFDVGYELAITYNLAILMCGEFKRSIHPVIATEAVRLKGLIKRRNHSTPNAEFDRGLMANHGYYDIQKGP